MSGSAMVGMRGVLALLWALAGDVAEAGIQSSVRVVRVDPAQRFSEVRFTNLGEEAVELSFDAVPWGLRTREADYDLLTYPPVTRMAPGQTQTVRLLVRDASGQPPPPPAFFRLLYRYKPVETAAPAPEVPPGTLGGRLSMKTAVSMPVTYVRKDAKPRPVVQPFNDVRGGLAALVVGNQGEHILRLTHFRNGGRRYPLNLTILPGEAARLEPAGKRPPFIFEAKNVPDFSYP